MSKPGFSKIALNMLCSVLSVCWCMPVHAEWTQLTQNAEGTFFYELAGPATGERVSVWRLTDFAKPLTNLEGKEVRSEKTLTSVDCKASKLANSQMTRYAGVHAQGDVMNHYETPERFTRVAPEGVDALLLKKLC